MVALVFSHRRVSGISEASVRALRTAGIAAHDQQRLHCFHVTTVLDALLQLPQLGRDEHVRVVDLRHGGRNAGGLARIVRKAEAANAPPVDLHGPCFHAVAVVPLRHPEGRAGHFGDNPHMIRAGSAFAFSVIAPCIHAHVADLGRVAVALHPASQLFVEVDHLPDADLGGHDIRDIVDDGHGTDRTGAPCVCIFQRIPSCQRFVTVVDVDDLLVAAVCLVASNPSENGIHHILSQLLLRHFPDLPEIVLPGHRQQRWIVRQQIILIAHHTGHFGIPKLVDLAAELPHAKVAVIPACLAPLGHPVGVPGKLLVVHIVLEHGAGGVDTHPCASLLQRLAEGQYDGRQCVLSKRQHVLVLHVHVDRQRKLASRKTVVEEIRRFLLRLLHGQGLAVPVAAHVNASLEAFVIVPLELLVGIKTVVTPAALQDGEGNFFGLLPIEHALRIRDVNAEAHTLTPPAPAGRPDWSAGTGYLPAQRRCPR